MKVEYLKICFPTIGYILGSSFFNFVKLFGKSEHYQSCVDQMSVSLAFCNVSLSLQVGCLRTKCHIESYFWGARYAQFICSTLFLNKLISGLSWQLHNVLFFGFPKLHTNWIFYLISFLRTGSVWILGLF